MNVIHHQILISALIIGLSGCASLNEDKTILDQSYLSGSEKSSAEIDRVTDAQELIRTKTNFTNIPSMSQNGVSFDNNQLAMQFKTDKFYQVTAQNMQLEDYLHYTLGELLGVNYLLTPEVSAIVSPVTLNISSQITERRLFELTEDVLAERGVSTAFKNGVYVLAKLDPKSKSSTRVGVGRNGSDVPSGNGTMMQIVPILYGVKTSLKTTVEQLTDVAINFDVKQSTLFIRGDRRSIVRALELIQLLDSPANRGRHIGMVKLAFIDANLYLEQMSTLLINEGIPNSIGEPNNNNLVFVPLDQIGAVAIFAANEKLLNRVKYWSRVLDKPSTGDVKKYYIFHPRYARATDIGESLSPLIDASIASSKVSVAAQSNSSDGSKQGTRQLQTASRNVGASNDKLTFVIDERSNAIIFYSSGTEYKNILPLIQKLDVLPKQVLLEVVIAEVNLTDDFQFGVEWALSRGDVTGGTNGAFGVSELGGLSLSSISSAGDIINANFFAENQNVNILSRPSLLVRDGVSASIEIGTQISVTGLTTDNFNSESGSQTTSSEYITTGIAINVTPTVNAQGIVIMTISQTLSNEVPAAAGATGNPDIFERSLSTEVVAESGQTIILAGLIDERDTITDTKVPLLGDIPILGNLFRSKGDNKTKTELVLMITPKVIRRTEQWTDIMTSFKDKLDSIKIN